MDIQKLVSAGASKAGLEPGAAVYSGESPEGVAPRIRVVDFQPEECRVREYQGAEEAARAPQTRGMRWVDVEGIHQPGVVGSVCATRSVHSLIVEDILNPSKRPKLEDMDEYLFVVLRALFIDGDRTPEEIEKNGYLSVRDDDGQSRTGPPSGVRSEQISILIGRDWVISFQEEAGGRDLFAAIRERLKQKKGRLCRGGPDLLAYALLDTVVDGYFEVLEDLGERIEALQDAILSDPERAQLGAIHAARRDVDRLRRAVWPLREVLSGLMRGDQDLVRESTRMYLRDVYDHVVEIMEAVDSFRELVMEMTDLYMSSVSLRMNQIMKVLTIISTVFMPLTFLVGVYGMNFHHMPELDWTWAYPALWVVMLGAAGGMLYGFRRLRWI